MSRPIRKSLLIHAVKLKKYSVDDLDDNYSNQIDVVNVRVDPTFKTIVDKQGDTINVSHMMFVDVTHSKPFSESDYVLNTNVVFNGKSLTIVAVDTIYTRKLHHLEVYLS